MKLNISNLNNVFSYYNFIPIVKNNYRSSNKSYLFRISLISVFRDVCYVFHIFSKYKLSLITKTFQLGSNCRLLSATPSTQHQKIRHRFNNKPRARVINLGVLFYVSGLYPSHCFVICETTSVNAKHSFLLY